jgi:hypothetical protein
MWRSSNSASQLDIEEAQSITVDQTDGTFAPRSIDEQVTVYVVFGIKSKP